SPTSDLLPPVTVADCDKGALPGAQSIDEFLSQLGQTRPEEVLAAALGAVKQAPDFILYSGQAPDNHWHFAHLRRDHTKDNLGLEQWQVELIFATSRSGQGFFASVQVQPANGHYVGILENDQAMTPSNGLPKSVIDMRIAPFHQLLSASKIPPDKIGRDITLSLLPDHSVPGPGTMVIRTMKSDFEDGMARQAVMNITTGGRDMLSVTLCDTCE